MIRYVSKFDPSRDIVINCQYYRIMPFMDIYYFIVEFFN